MSGFSHDDKALQWKRTQRSAKCPQCRCCHGPVWKTRAHPSLPVDNHGACLLALAVAADQVAQFRHLGREGFCADRGVSHTVWLRFQGTWEHRPDSRLGQNSAHEDACPLPPPSNRTCWCSLRSAELQEFCSTWHHEHSEVNYAQFAASIRPSGLASSCGQAWSSALL